MNSIYRVPVSDVFNNQKFYWHGRLYQKIDNKSSGVLARTLGAKKSLKTYIGRCALVSPVPCGT